MNHPDCPKCNVPMWLIRARLGEIAEQHLFECQVCETLITRTLPAVKQVFEPEVTLQPC